MRTRSMAVLSVLLLAVLAIPSAVEATMLGENGRIVFTAGTDAGSQVLTVRSNGTGLRPMAATSGRSCRSPRSDHWGSRPDDR